MKNIKIEDLVLLSNEKLYEMLDEVNQKKEIVESELDDLLMKL